MLNVQSPSLQIKKIDKVRGLIQFREAGWRQQSWNVGAKELCHIGNEKDNSIKRN